MAELFTTQVFRPPHPVAPIQTTPKMNYVGKPEATLATCQSGQVTTLPSLTQVEATRKVLLADLKYERVQFPSPLIVKVTPPDVKRKVRLCSSYSAVGTIEGQAKPANQDSFLVCEVQIQDKPAYLLMVSDGHGESGHRVSSYLTTYLPCFFLEALETVSDILPALVSAYQQTNDSMRKCDLDVLCSGSTCLTMVVLEGEVFIANVGDSRAVLCQKGSEGLTAVTLTTDHKPDVPSERRRLEEAGGRVEASCGANGQSVGPLRLWFQGENTPGLTLSRAMGDFLASPIGLISTPDVCSMHLVMDDEFIILASDGIWEFLETEEAVGIVKRLKDEGREAAAAAELVQLARARWSRSFTSVDDITAIIAFIGE